MNNNPILNNPYEEPRFHYATSKEGELDYDRILEGRRIFTPDIKVIPSKQGDEKSIFSINDYEEKFGTELINLMRKEVGQWRSAGYSQTTRVTRELLDFWFNDPGRDATKQMFFAQREAVETAIWINEVAEKSNAGNHILERLKNYQTINGQPENNLPRIAFKMATGAGKTVVMAALILYHFFNRQEYRNDARFADNFLVVTPGITIKDRLGVLFVDTLNTFSQDIRDYYRVRGLVPRNLERSLLNLNAKIIITNYHALEPRALSGNKKSPFDGKLNEKGEKTVEKEDFNLVIKRVLGKFKAGSRLLILNDEAHHCYLPRERGMAADGENTVEENARAAVWYNGLVETAKRFKVKSVYDLSATPYFLNGSGYEAYSLFPWTVMDFGLIEAIESGLVKIPFLPESDSTQELEMPVLRNLYEHVKDELPRKGQRTRKADAKKEGKTLREEPPRLPAKVKAALDQFYNHYRDASGFIGKEQLTMTDTPPVFIVVCNNTSVSREMYKFIAGYEITDDSGEILDVVPGYYDILSNYDKVTKKPHHRPPTLLIDSDALENSNQVNEEFKKVFSREIEEFRKEYRLRHPDRSAENIDDADILREVINTVGSPNTLGAHVRCVVSVSMLTEGWDARTVTHIMGLRAFGSQLLCEQVAGRALRRRNYYLEAYDKNGNPTTDSRKAVTRKFPPEYAHIIGVPFRMFKGGKTTPPPPVDYTRVFALPEREKQYEITFPNLIGYRIESAENEILADFSGIENFVIDGTKYPVETEMGSAFTPEHQTLKVKSVLEMRDQEIIYYITKELIRHYYTDDEGNAFFQKFNRLKRIVAEWYDNKIVLPGITDDNYRRLLFFLEPKVICDHIMRGIYSRSRSGDTILPVFNFYNKFGSTKYVNGSTSREVYPASKSHVNYVVADTQSWEQIAAKTLEEIPEVESYVKNAFLGFFIPYVGVGKDRQYFPDFIARCKTKSGKRVNLVIEITGMNQDKDVKKWFVENRWLPAVNAVRDKYGYDEWHFIEIAGDIRFIKNQLSDKIRSLQP